MPADTETHSNQVHEDQLDHVADATGLDAAAFDVAVLDGFSAVELARIGLGRMRAETEASSSVELAAVMVEVETISRQAHALSIDVLELSEHGSLHYQDGHSSAKVMARHVNRLSGAEAHGREQCRRMFKQLTKIAAAYRAGTVGTDQVKLLGRVFANKRVRGAMQDRQDWFLEHATKLSFKRFQQRVLEWQRLIDEDGTEPPGDRVAANRFARLRQDPTDLSWDLSANFTSVDGAINSTILEGFVQKLFDADWAEAKTRIGDGVCKADLARTDAQRHADAITLIFELASQSDSPLAPANITHDIVWTESAYTEMARQYAGAKPQPFDVDDYRCETIDGHPLDPFEAFANSIVNNIRRVVINAKGVVIDLGVARRFTGLARTAVRLTQHECYWPGCEVPATRCETDHFHDHAKGGRTNPGNGAPGCGRHNRWKQKGFRAWRDAHGNIRITRPNGTEIH